MILKASFFSTYEELHDTTHVYSGTTLAAMATPVASTTLTLADGKIYTIYTKGLNRTKTLSVGTVLHN